MKQIIYFIINTVFIVACGVLNKSDTKTKNISENYFLYGNQIRFEENGEFTLEMYRSKRVKGRYLILNDTIILNSEYDKDSIKWVNVELLKVDSLDKIHLKFNNVSGTTPPVKATIKTSREEFSYWDLDTIIEKREYTSLKVLCYQAASRNVNFDSVDYNLIEVNFDYPSRPQLYKFFDGDKFILHGDTLVKTP